jgi:uncharacterized membrane protein
MVRRGLGLFLTALTVIFGILAVLPFVAPTLATAGFGQFAHTIFAGFSVTCHQIPEHSFFLFGHPVAVCQREVGIYVGLFASSLVYHRFSGQLGPMPIRLYMLAVAPIMIDGLSQMLGLRESDWLLRVTTGGLFGASTVWMFFPRFSHTLSEIDAYLSSESTVPRRSVARLH